MNEIFYKTTLKVVRDNQKYFPIDCLRCFQRQVTYLCTNTHFQVIESHSVETMFLKGKK